MRDGSKNGRREMATKILIEARVPGEEEETFNVTLVKSKKSTRFKTIFVFVINKKKNTYTKNQQLTMTMRLDDAEHGRGTVSRNGTKRKTRSDST